MDYLIDTGTDEESDHDRTKILRTILITFIILSRGRGFGT
jgi:hypothetical protein